MLCWVGLGEWGESGISGAWLGGGFCLCGFVCMMVGGEGFGAGERKASMGVQERVVWFEVLSA